MSRLSSLSLQLSAPAPFDGRGFPCPHPCVALGWEGTSMGLTVAHRQTQGLRGGRQSLPQGETDPREGLWGKNLGLEMGPPKVGFT